jgi:hypothetical protein
MSHLVTPATNGQPVPGPRRDLWPYAVFALAVLAVLFRLVPETRPGVLGVVCWDFGMGLVPYAAWAVLAVGVVWSLVRRPFLTRRRALAFVLLIGLGFSDRLYRVYPSSHDGQPSRVAFRLPIDGPVTVGWGGATPAVNYHVVAPDQRWAYDLLVTRGGSTHKGDGSLLTDYYAYRLPVLAPAAGAVVEAFDGDPDMPLGEPKGFTSASGNFVTIEVAPGEFLQLCHLLPGSVRVKKGDRVAEGEPVGLVGNSGNTSEPHLHVHLQDSPVEDFAEGIPMEFHHYRTADGRLVARGIPTGGISDEGKLLGQVVENAPTDAPPAEAGATTTPEARNPR